MNTVNALTLVPNFDSIVINEMNLSTGILYKHIQLLKTSKSWHKFIVKNTENLTRNEVLKAILDRVYPLDFIPVFYIKDPESSNAHFLARNCDAAIEKLCKEHLIVNHPNSNLTNKLISPLKLTIILNCASNTDIQINVQSNVSSVVNKRFDNLSKILNLNGFADDPDLTEYCPLSQPKIMYFVLHIAKTLNPEEIILANNQIKTLSPMDVLIGLKLKRLDLSNNELVSFNDLEALKYFQIKEIKLTGNMLCNNCDEWDYIFKIKKLCPTIEILDCVVLALDKFPVLKRYSLCDYGSMNLINEFLECFFRNYDNDRGCLAELYHNEAMFSLTCVYLSGQLSSGSASLRLYSSISRNLLKSADLSKTSEFLFKGRDSIIETFCLKLPLTEHDPYSFTADLMYKTDTCVIVVITGIYREKSTSLLEQERLLGFARTFVLQINDCKCVITNDQLHLYNALTYQEKHSFTHSLVNTKMFNKEHIPKAQSKADNEDLILTLSHITSLKEEWSRKCLEERSYDLKSSLELFIDLYKSDKFPMHAFISSD